MTVAELIEELNNIEDKNLPVYAWNVAQGELEGFVTAVDDTLDTRVDININ